MRWLTENEKQFIEDRYLTMNHKQMAEMLFVPIQLVEKYCEENNFVRVRVQKQKEVHKLSKDVKKFVDSNYKTMSRSDISKQVKVSYNIIGDYYALKGYDSELAEEKRKIERYITSNYKDLLMEEMAEKLNIEVDEVSRVLVNLGLVSKNKELALQKRREAEKFIDDNYKHMTVDELRKGSGLTEPQVMYYVDKMFYTPKGLIRRSKSIEVSYKQEQAHAFIRENYKTMTHKQIGNIIGLSRQSVATYCSQNKLYKTKLRKED